MADFSWAPDGIRALLLYKDGKLMIGCSAEGCSALRHTSGKGAVLKKIGDGLVESLYNCREHGAIWGKFSQAQIYSWPEGHKMCKSCLEIKEFSEFHKHAQALFGYAVECKECRRPGSKNDWKGRSFEQTMLASSKFRANKFGIPHTITIDDIFIPSVCPILDVAIVLERNHIYGPSLDQIRPRLGYTPDNVQVISRRANHLKSNMTPLEAGKIAEFLRINFALGTNPMDNNSKGGDSK